MFLEAEGRKFEILFGSVVDDDKDGFYAELNELTEGEAIFIFEAFWSDESNKFIFTASGESHLPFEIVEKFVEIARKRVPPLSFIKEEIK